jgi:hypothetical protein
MIFGSTPGGYEAVIQLLNAVGNSDKLKEIIEGLRAQEEKAAALISEKMEMLRAEQKKIDAKWKEYEQVRRLAKAESDDFDLKKASLDQATSAFYKLKAEFEIYENETRLALSDRLERLNADRIAFDNELARRQSEIKAKESRLESALLAVAAREAKAVEVAEQAEARKLEYETKLLKLKEITG